MGYLVFALVGFACGGLAMFFALDAKRKRVEKLHQQQETQVRQNQERSEEINNRQKQLNQAIASLNSGRQEFEKQVISYRELTDENGLLKRDLRNLAINMRKLELDRDVQPQSQAVIAQKVDEIGSRYLKENVKWIGNSLNANNFASCKQRLQDVIERCRGIGFQITEVEEASYIADLRAEYEKVVRAAFEREEQARIKAHGRFSASKHELSESVPSCKKHWPRRLRRPRMSIAPKSKVLRLV